MIQYRWRERVLGSTATGTIDDENHFFTGTDPTRGSRCICPSLNAWLGEELHKESQMKKEQRKARAERALLHTGKNKQQRPPLVSLGRCLVGDQLLGILGCDPQLSPRGRFFIPMMTRARRPVFSRRARRIISCRCSRGNWRTCLRQSLMVRREQAYR